MEKNLKKNTIWNIIGTGINSFTSLFLMLIVTRINKIDEAGVFTFAFSIAILLNIIGTYAGRIYQVTERKDISNKDYLVNRIITCSIMIIAVFVLIIIGKYDFNKSIIIILLCLLKLLEAFCDVIYGFLQRNDELFKVGISFTLKNVIGIIVFLVVDIVTKNLIISIISFIVVYVIVTVLYDFIQCKSLINIKEKAKKDNVLNIFKYGFPTFCVTFLNMYLINASKYSLDGIMSSDNQAIFGIIIMPATMMILMAQFMVHPFLNIITNCIKNNDYKSINKLLIKISVLLFILGILAIVFCYFVGIHILEFIYGISLINYNLCLSVILLGAIFSALISVITTVLIAMRYTLIQMIVYGAVSIITFFVSKILITNFGLMGASLNYTLSMFATFIIFLIIYMFLTHKIQKGSKNKV